MPQVNRSKFTNANWTLNQHPTDPNAVTSTEHAILATLMDVRDELQKLNGVLGCHNAIAIPKILRDIKKNTAKRKRVDPIVKRKKSTIAKARKGRK